MSSPTPSRTPWTRGDRIGAASLVVAILAIILALTQPEVRSFIGLDHSSLTLQATETAVSANGAATVQAQATAEAEKEIYTQVTTRDPVLDDSLASPSSHNWREVSQSNYGCAFQGGKYHAWISQQFLVVRCYASATNFQNLALQVQMTTLRGAGGGLIFRANSSGDIVFTSVQQTTMIFLCKTRGMASVSYTVIAWI